MSNFMTGVSMILLTVGIFFVAKKLYIKFKNPLLNPTLITTIIVIILLLFLNTSYDTYMIGGKWIHELLGPTVVALALPLYKYKSLLAKYFQPIMFSILLAIIINILSVYIFLSILGYPKEMILTAFSKSITTAVAIQISSQVGGISSLTAVYVMIAGFTGAILGPFLIKLCKFENDIARGMAFGNASHAIGTTKAFEYNLETGSVSSAGMILSAIFSSILIPFFVWILF